MKIICTSDLHGHLPTIPECDLLIIAGDICPANNHEILHQWLWLDTVFRRWLRATPARQVVATWGNHDIIGQRAPEQVPDLPWKLLVDEMFVWEGLRIWGTPWSRDFFPETWAFNMPEEGLAEKNYMTPRCDIAISHGPLFNYGDRVRDEHVGCYGLYDWALRCEPRLVVTGHIHCDPGQWQLGPTTIINPAHLNDRYKPQQDFVEKTY